LRPAIDTPAKHAGVGEESAPDAVALLHGKIFGLRPGELVE
jgi:hypothetical protein